MGDNSDTFIDEAFLDKLARLRVVTRKSPKGPQRGAYRSWQSGEGYEFLDYRKYHEGDDLRYLDWSVYGRLDKLFIKLFHAEENQTVHILLDMSRSMGQGRPSKAVCGKKIAAAVGYICLSNLDKIGLMSFADRIHAIRAPARGKKIYPQVLGFLHGLRLSGETDVNACLSEYASICKNPGIAIIISDLLDPKGCAEGLGALIYKKFETHLIHVLDHEERYWSKTGNLLLSEVETGEKKLIFVDQSLLEIYRETMDTFIRNIQNDCDRYSVSYYPWDTHIAFEDFLIDSLTKGPIFR
jgi:uncharacterized protein (DUF58 family)